MRFHSKWFGDDHRCSMFGRCDTCRGWFWLMTLARMEARLNNFSLTIDLREPVQLQAEVWCPLCWKDRRYVALIKFDVFSPPVMCAADDYTYRLREIR